MSEAAYKAAAKAMDDVFLEAYGVRLTDERFDWSRKVVGAFIGEMPTLYTVYVDDGDPWDVPRHIEHLDDVIGLHLVPLKEANDE